MIAKSGRIDKNSIIVSIETSSELPGAVSGSGPIIRTGDRATTFDNSGEIILLSSVKKLVDQNNEPKIIKDFKLLVENRVELTHKKLKQQKINQ